MISDKENKTNNIMTSKEQLTFDTQSFYVTVNDITSLTSSCLDESKVLQKKLKEISVIVNEKKRTFLKNLLSTIFQNKMLAFSA